MISILKGCCFSSWVTLSLRVVTQTMSALPEGQFGHQRRSAINIAGRKWGVTGVRPAADGLSDGGHRRHRLHRKSNGVLTSTAPVHAKIYLPVKSFGHHIFQAFYAALYLIHLMSEWLTRAFRGQHGFTRGRGRSLALTLTLLYTQPHVMRACNLDFFWILLSIFHSSAKLK